MVSNNAALSDLRRNNRHPSLAFPRTKLVLRRYDMFKPYLVYRLAASFSPRVRGGLPLLDGGTVGASVAAANQTGLNVEAEEDDLL